jgi:predicted ATPase
VESESELPFGGAHQLVHSASAQLRGLSDQHRSALERAFGLGFGSDAERFVVFAACLALLCEIADSGPVLCLVDDAQWLDDASSNALLFVARRLANEGIVMLFAVREDDAHRFDAQDLPSLSVPPLAPDAASMLLGRTTESLATPVTERLLAHARGNPLALIELPKALSDGQLIGAEPLPATLPLTEQL